MVRQLPRIQRTERKAGEEKQRQARIRRWGWGQVCFGKLNLPYNTGSQSDMEQLRVGMGSRQSSPCSVKVPLDKGTSDKL